MLFGGGRKRNDGGISRRGQLVPGSAAFGVLRGSQGCRGVPPSSAGGGLAGWAPVRLPGLPGGAGGGVRSGSWKVLAAAQHPAGGLEHRRRPLWGSDVPQMERLRCAGARSEAAGSRAVTGAHAGWHMLQGTGPSPCPGEPIHLWMLLCTSLEVAVACVLRSVAGRTRGRLSPPLR